MSLIQDDHRIVLQQKVTLQNSKSWHDKQGLPIFLAKIQLKGTKLSHLHFMMAHHYVEDNWLSDHTILEHPTERPDCTRQHYDTVGL
jgi:hypothetical protein